MKKITFITMLLMMAVSLSYAFTVDNIEYTIISGTTTVEVGVSASATGDITIPEMVEDGGITYTVTSIAASAFRASPITSFIMPNTVTTMGRLAFYNCSALTSANLSSGMITMGDKVWSKCIALTDFACDAETPFVIHSLTFESIDLSSATLTVTSAAAVTAYSAATTWSAFGQILQPGALSPLNDITSFVLAEQTSDADIDNAMHTVDVTVLTGTNLTALTPTIATSVNATISPNSGVARDFSDTVVYTVTAEDGSTQDWSVIVEEGAVEYFTANGVNYHVTSNTIPYTVEVDVNDGFSGAVIIPETVDASGITYAVTSIVGYAFAENANVTSITIGNNVISIGERAFIRNTGATSLVLGTSVESIATLAFFNLLVTEITLPASVTSIATRVFEQNTNLTTFTLENSTPVVIDESVFRSTDIANATLVVPNAQAVIDYSAALIWADFGTISVNVPTALYEEESRGFKLYPNPTIDVITISGVEESVSIELYNTAGVLINTSMNNSFDVSNLAAGMYLVKAGQHIESFMKK